MWSGKETAVESIARLYGARVRAHKCQKEQVRASIQKQHERLNEWLFNNQLSLYCQDVNCAKLELLRLMGEQKDLSSLKNILRDFEVLNKAVRDQDVTGLLGRAKERLHYVSPTGIGLGCMLAAVAIAIMAFGAVIACPPILIIGMIAFMGGVSLATFSAGKVQTVEAHKLFSVVKAIRPGLDEEKDLLGQYNNYVPGW